MWHKIRIKGSIRYKVAVFVFITALCIALASFGVCYYSINKVVKKNINQGYVEEVKILSHSINYFITKEVEHLIGNTTNPFWLSCLETANAKYNDQEADTIEKHLLQLDKEWVSAPDNSSFIEHYLTTPLSISLRKERAINSEIAEVFITDKEGGLIAASGRTTDFYQADEKWWQEAFNNGSGKVFIGDSIFDQSAKVFSFVVALPIYDAHRRVVGVCKNVVSLKKFFYLLNSFEIGETGYAGLIGKDGRVLFSGEAESMEKVVLPGGHYRDVLICFDNVRKYKTLIAFDRVDNDFLLTNGIEWTVFISQGFHEAYAPLEIFIKQEIIFSVVLLVLTIILGFLFGRRIVKPIEKLQRMTEMIKEGFIDYKEKIDTGDEIEKLAKSFEQMLYEINEKQKEIIAARIHAENIISSMTDIVIILNFKGLITQVNQAAINILGYSKQELMSQPVFKIFSEENKSDAEMLVNGIRENLSYGLHVNYKTKEGDLIPISIVSSVLRDVNDFPIGMVCVARDMRDLLTLISDLEQSKAQLEDLTRELEYKVDQRTKEIKESQAETLKALKDVSESKKQLEDLNERLKISHDLLESSTRDLEDKVQERTFELSVLYEVSQIIFSTKDCDHLFKLILEALFRIVDCDICGLLFFDKGMVDIIINTAHSRYDKFVGDVKYKLIDSISMFIDEKINEEQINLFSDSFNITLDEHQSRSFDELRSFFNVPLFARGKIIGIINVSSFKDRAFSENDVRLIYTVVNQVSISVERLRSVIITEQSKMENMVESMVEGIIMIDARGELAILNPSAQWMLGFSTVNNITSNMVREKMTLLNLPEAFEQSQKAGRSITKEISVYRNKERKILNCDVTTVKDLDGYNIGVVTILRDVTQERELDKMKTEFISTVSHELRTPLTIIREGVSQILDGVLGSVTELQRSCLQLSLEGIDRLGRIIDNLLDISKIEVGKACLNRDMVDIVMLTKEVCNYFSDAAEDKGLEIIDLLPKGPVEVYVDRDKMIQVLTNLINNAIKFTDRGHIKVSLENTEKSVRCRILDTGRGIAKNDLPKLFNKFQQFNRTHGEGEKGTGLGLSIVKGIVEEHGGEIHAQSTLNSGSKFEFTIPKYNNWEMLLLHVKRYVEDILASQELVSFLLLCFGGGEHLDDDAVKHVDQLIKDHLIYQDDVDISVQYKNSILVTLPNVIKEEALMIAGRLQQAIVDSYVLKGISEHIDVFCSVCNFPEDGDSFEMLFWKMKKLKDFFNER